MINLLLDLDTGIDDAIALSIAAKDERINLLGVTCTYGNVTVDESAYNTLALLSLLDRSDVHVYKGRDRALLSSSPYIPHEAGRKIHGPKGSGDITLKESKRSIEKINALHQCFETAAKEGIESPAVEKAVLMLLESNAVEEARQKGIKYINDGCNKFLELFGKENPDAILIKELFTSMIPSSVKGEAHA